MRWICTAVYVFSLTSCDFLDSRRIPYCLLKYEECIDSPLGDRRPEGSICQHCMGLCRTLGFWPDRLPSGQTCIYSETQDDIVTASPYVLDAGPPLSPRTLFDVDAGL